jgi:hypothetical protein
VLVGIEAVDVMAVYQPVVQHNRLICRQNIDCVYTDEHRKTILIILAKHRTAP